MLLRREETKQKTVSRMSSDGSNSNGKEEGSQQAQEARQEFTRGITGPSKMNKKSLQGDITECGTTCYTKDPVKYGVTCNIKDQPKLLAEGHIKKLAGSHKGKESKCFKTVADVGTCRETVQMTVAVRKVRATAVSLGQN